MDEEAQRQPNRKLIGTVIVAACAVLGVVVALTWPRPPQQLPSSPAQTQQPPGITVKRPVLKHMEKGQLAWQAQLRELHIAAGGQMIEAKGLEEAIIYGKAGEPLVRLTADKITGHTGHRDFEVSGNVRVVSYRAAIISTDKLSWNQEQQLLSCPDTVEVKNEQAIIMTSGLDYFVAQDLAKCPGQVTMYAGDSTVVGSNLEYNVATGNFRLEKIQMVFHAEEAKEKLKELRQQ